jgi:N-acetyl-anhydromuramyl-L-alanine amidase AmpD
MRWLILACVLSVAGCATPGFVDVPSENQNSRVNYLVIHFTTENFEDSLKLLTQTSENPVSAHYLVPAPGDETYKSLSLRIHRLVPEYRRAWHAGISYWGGVEALNNNSIGIEIVNLSACVDHDPDTESPTPEEQTCVFLEYPDEQLELLFGLIAEIMARYTEIDAVDVVGHADIAPDRRVDPGPLFPWQRLYELGIGAWYDEDTFVTYRDVFEIEMPDLATLQRALHSYGYEIAETGEYDVQTRFVVRAFQMHFRPADISGKFDTETAAILFALTDKYRPGLPAGPD